MTFEELDGISLKRLIHQYSDILSHLKNLQHQYQISRKELRKLLNWCNQTESYRKTYREFTTVRTFLDMKFLRKIGQMNCALLKMNIRSTQKLLNQSYRLILQKIRLEH